MSRIPHNGLAIALAWPQTYCKQTSVWYNRPMKWLGFNRRHYYKAGHAAIVLIDKDKGTCHYFDFGRYHAPYQYGRVRSSETDPELSIQTAARFDKRNRLINLAEILEELANRKACHGDGPLHASCCPLSFDKAMQKALAMQQQSPLPYGPFVPKGTNCSRFVNTVIMAGNPSFLQRLKLSFPYTLTPAPLTNIYALSGRHIISPMVHSGHRTKPAITDPKELKKCLPAPAKPANIPEDAQWLSGEGAGSWFFTEQHDQVFIISRFSPEGKREFSRPFLKTGARSFSPGLPCRFTYLSHAQKVHIFQEGQIHEFVSLSGICSSGTKEKADIQKTCAVH